ncbi:MAG: DUF1996 domain-containing protein [Polynucleobacter sp.]
MIRYVLAALALLATPALAADPTVSGCSSVAANRVATSKDTAKLAADLACLDKVPAATEKLAAPRRARLAALTPTPAVALSPADLTQFVQRDPGGVPALEPGGYEGAFRLVCSFSHLNWDDAVLYPGKQGGSAHLHQNFGNPTTSYASTYDTLGAAGEGTCGGPGNQSAYWAPALLNAAGKVILPDGIALYYKRLPSSDPRCFQQAAKGCAPLPQGLRVVQGWDMALGRMNGGDVAHRCISDGRPSIHRATLAEAIADCGGEGQIMTRIIFGNCWNGQLDSPDHRSHLATQTYGERGYPECPATHPWLIPQQTQQFAYTVTKADGPIRYSCDRMPGMAELSGGTCFHADYMEHWVPAVRETWERNCLDKQLSCVAGQLGDGTILKQRPVAPLASPRLVDAPARP